MSGPDPIKSDRRRAHREHRFPPGTACALCGETTPEALQQAGGSLIEAHHAAGRSNDPGLLVPLCCNCHRRITAGQLDAGVDLSHAERSMVERIAGALRSLAVFLRALAEAFERFANELLTPGGRRSTSHPRKEMT